MGPPAGRSDLRGARRACCRLRRASVSPASASASVTRDQACDCLTGLLRG